jgi:hypothetical protein
MIASTCLAVALVPVFYVEIQTWVEKRQAKHDAKVAARLAAHERAMAAENARSQASSIPDQSTT